MNRNNRGFVLLCVLWVTALLTVLVLGFGKRAMLDRRAAAYAMDHSLAMAAARGAVERGVLELQNRQIMQRLLPPDQRGGTHLGESWANPKNCVGEGYYEQEEMLKGDEITYIITDMERLIDINTAPRELLEGVESLNRSMIRHIWVRRTEDTNQGEGIIPFHAVEELRNLRGVGDEEWFGDKRKTGVKDLLTIWGDGKINVNTASRAVLESIPNVRESDIDVILDYRAGGDGKLNTGDDRGFMNMDDLTVKTGVTGDTRDALNGFCKCDSSYFKITGLATRRNGRVRAVCTAVVSAVDGLPYVVEWQEKALGS